LPLANATFAGIHRAISSRLVRSCHDLSEGGLAVAAAEMALAGGIGLELSLGDFTYIELPPEGQSAHLVALFSESNTRFLCEVAPQNASAFEAALSGIPTTKLGVATEAPTLHIKDRTGKTIINASIQSLKDTWKAPLSW
jgi:phosphoribosylformylglycinamidine synthase subunit PurSL